MSYKKIYDPVHGFIKLTPLEKKLIDSYAFQRLHYIHQLGVAYLVYPGATHTRFEHSLGVMEVATQIFDRILETTSCRPAIHSVSYWRQVVRFAALCHDLGHLPFSHLAEKNILGKQGHEYWTMALIKSDFIQPIWKEFLKGFPEANIIEDVIKISVGEEKLRTLGPEWKEKSFSPWEKVMVQIIAGNFFGADRIDYLLRDARCTGVSYGLFDYHQLIEMLRILPCQENGKESLTLGIEENGLESCEALLLARHFMHKRVYQYPSVLAYSFHMARFMQKLYEKTSLLSSLNAYLSYTDNEVLVDLKQAFFNKNHESHEDALALFVRENRYEVIMLPQHIQEEDVVKWRDRFQVPAAEAELSFCKQESSEFSFPVLSGDKVLDTFPRSIVSIPSFSANRLYLSSKHKDHLFHLLEG